MNENKKKFYSIVRLRSEENVRSFNLLYDAKCYGNCISLLRQELDSYIRVLFLKSQSNSKFVNNCINYTLNGKRWAVTDAKMLESLNFKLGNSWEGVVYKLGCSFIHLSNFHNYIVENPFSTLSQDNRNSIVSFIKQYHNIDVDIDNYKTIISVLPLVMNKISENLQGTLALDDKVSKY